MAKTRAVSAGEQFSRSVERLLIAGERQERKSEVIAPARAVLALLLACALAIFPWWLRLDSFWSDSPRWMMECLRAWQGELPYRDFSYQYPPLSLWLMVAVFKLFGPTFLATQITLAVLGIAQVLLLWRLARALLPGALALGVSLLFVAAMTGTTFGNESVFSLDVYTPSYPLGNLCYLLFLNGAVDLLKNSERDTHLPPRSLAALALGANGCLLTKPEYALGVILVLVAGLFWFGERAKGLGRWATIAALCIVPAALVYAVFARVVGAGNLWDGITGYGQTTIFTPWWPTGFALVSVLVDLLGGLVFAAVPASLIFLSLKADPARPVRVATVATLLVSAALLVVYVILVRDTGPAPGAPVPPTWQGFLWTGSYFNVWLRTIKWLACLIAAGLPFYLLARRRPRRQIVGPRTAGLYVVSLAAFAVSVRSLFVHHLSGKPAVSLPAYPLLFLLGAFALWYCLTYGLPLLRIRRAGPDGEPLAPLSATRWAVTIALLGVVISVARAVTYHTGRVFVPLTTEAGLVWVREEDGAAEFYKFVVENSKPDARILDMCYGGGLTFASRRRSATFLTQYLYLKPGPEIVRRDLEILKANPPDLLIVLVPLRNYIYGGAPQKGMTVFPEFVWLPVRKSLDTGTYAEHVAYLSSRYRPVAAHGNRVVSVADPSSQGVAPPVPPAQ